MRVFNIENICKDLHEITSIWAIQTIHLWNLANTESVLSFDCVVKNCSVPSRLSLPSLRSLSQLAVAYKEQVRRNTEGVCWTLYVRNIFHKSEKCHKENRKSMEKSRLSRPAAAWAATAAERTARKKKWRFRDVKWNDVGNKRKAQQDQETSRNPMDMVHLIMFYSGFPAILQYLHIFMLFFFFLFRFVSIMFIHFPRIVFQSQNLA